MALFQLTEEVNRAEYILAIYSFDGAMHLHLLPLEVLLGTLDILFPSAFLESYMLCYNIFRFRKLEWLS